MPFYKKEQFKVTVGKFSSAFVDFTPYEGDELPPEQQYREQLQGVHIRADGTPLAEKYWSVTEVSRTAKSIRLQLCFRGSELAADLKAGSSLAEQTRAALAEGAELCVRMRMGDVALAEPPPRGV